MAVEPTNTATAPKPAAPAAPAKPAAPPVPAAVKPAVTAEAKPQPSQEEKPAQNFTTADAKDRLTEDEQKEFEEAIKSGMTASDFEKKKNAESPAGFVGEGYPPGPSGAIVETEIRQDQQLEHPAVDNRPRYGVPIDATRIDFNDPTK